MNVCFDVVEDCTENQIHPLEDLTYVGSGSVIIFKKKPKHIYKLYIKIIYFHSFLCF